MRATIAQRRAFDGELRQAAEKGGCGDVLVPRAFGPKAGGGKRFGDLTLSEICGLQQCLGLPSDDDRYDADCDDYDVEEARR